MDQNKISIEGVVLECLRGTEFSVQIDLGNGYKKNIVGYISGKMRKNYIKVSPGDRVLVEISKYDLLRGRIVKRL